MDDETQMVVFTALFVGLFAKLNARGLISKEDLRDIFENATLGLEEMGLDNPTALKAHNFLSSLQTVVEGRPPKSA